MKRILNLSYCIGFFLLYITSGYCQKKFKFGDVTREEFKNNTTKDSTVGAVVLFDIGKSYFSTTATHIQLIFEHHRRIKILTKDGYDWANGRIELMSSNSSEETVSKFDATTYNLENGKVVPTAMKKDGIFNDKVIDDYLIKKFTLPNVKEGSIIEYKYKITSPFIFNIQPWTFQENIPVQLSQYSCEIPSFFQFKTEMKGFEPISTEVKKEVKAIIPGDPTHVENYVFTGNNLPSFQEESYLTSAENYKTSVEFEISSINIPGTFSKPLLNDWPHICARLLEDEDFGKILERKGAVKEKVDSVIKGSKTEEEKMISIYNFVRSSFKWNGDNGVSASQRLKKTLEEKRGNAGDINLLLTLMLRAAGLPADPVILSTRKHGMINPYLTPMAKKYNYVIGHVKLGETKYMLDATDAWRPYDVLPERCINGQGRLIAQNSSEWVDLKNNETFTGLDILQLNLSEEGEMEGEINCLRKSYAAFLAREKVGKKPSDYLEAKKKEKENWEIKDLKIENLEKLQESFTEKYQVKISNMATKSGDKIYLDPIIVDRVSENPFKLDERKYPVDFAFPITKSYICNIKVPKGYALDEKIPPSIVALPNKSGKFSYEIAESDGILSIKSIYSINKAMFPPEEYAFLKEFYNQIIARHTQQIVLKKM